MNTKNNQRYRDMDICIKAAMLELMQTTPFEKITVKSVCQRAGVNRGTFYAHYEDMNGMINHLEEYLTEDMLRSIEEWNRQGENGSIFLPYLRYIREHRYVYRVILSNRKTLPLQKSFQPLLKQLLTQCETAEITEEEITYYNIYFQAGVIMVLRHWIETNCKTDERQLAMLLMNCIPAIASTTHDRQNVK